MNTLVLLKPNEVDTLLNKRQGESKFGEHVQLLTSSANIYDDIKSLDVKYVLIGLPEDVGVFANHGKSGTSTTWDSTIKILLNTQSNQFINPKDILILGHLDFSKAVNITSKLKQNNSKHINKVKKLVTEIDKDVSNLIFKIVNAGKIPIIIGGGHNNAYGNIKGTSLALKKSINCINFDAHTDFRALEGRHSGNGFSYAFSEGFLDRYFIFGIHENYTSASIFNTLKAEKRIEYNTYEAIAVRQQLKFKAEMKRALKHISNKPFGIEIDCDAMQNIPSSAQTPSGFSVEKTRQFINYFGSSKQAKYIHICEAAPKKKQVNQVGKLISFLITDFIKSQS
ncbi:formimidoylglutamase [uncultured Lacinutrix sp.]|uniref:formimidoylglutamase n=1 Tax=uncultured Lacinutrix sp. TaxID=574032 RepID=UPI00261097DB|nr:formimidoylglutamase [uncultured Lacinutrix sp.]